MRQLPLIAWARYIALAAIFLLPVFLIPAPWFPLQLGKLALFSVLALAAMLLFVIGGGLGGLACHRGARASALVYLLPLAYLASYWFSTDRAVGFSGYAFESDTVVFIFLAAAAFLLSFALFRRLSSLTVLLYSLMAAAGVVFVFQLVSILGGTRVLSALFSDSTVNLVGKWNDLGLLCGMALVVLVAVLETAPLSALRRTILSLIAAADVLFLAVVQFPTIWWLTLVSCAIVGAWTFFSRGRAGMRALPWVSIAGMAVSVLLLLWGAIVGGGLTKVFPVSSLEVRPALSTTLDIVRSSHGASVERFLVGTGPQTFSDNWFLYKPLAVNQSQFWNLDFNVGYSTLATALGTVGVLGALAWLIPLILALIGGARILRFKQLSPEETKLGLMACLLSLYAWGSIVLYVPSEDLLLLSFVLAGAAFGISGKLSQQQAGIEPRARLGGALVVWAVYGICIVLLALAAWTSVRRYMSEVYVNQGLAALQQNNSERADSLAARARDADAGRDAVQLSVLAGISRMQAIVQSTSTPSAAVQSNFTAIAQKTIAFAQSGAASYPSDYQAYVALGRVYDLLASLGVAGAYQSAKTAYQSAVVHNPTDPELPLAIARLEAGQGNKQSTMEALQSALKLKPDYTDAILFAVQLYVADKDITNAIAAAKAAVQSAPGVASIWFELGLLYYSANDMPDAAIALGQAVQLVPDYANAKYFLGLAYAAENRTADAIQQFKDLSISNPGNTEVQLILSNLQAGKPPFAGAQPPVTSKPQNRTTAPIQ